MLQLHQILYAVKRNSSFLLGLMLLLGSGTLHAQEAVPDSVIVMGTVVDHLTNEPQPNCLLQFLCGTDTSATVRCDEEGYFIDSLPVGAYTLRVTLNGHQVYLTDLVLNDNAALHIAVITDSFSFRILQPVEVTALKSKLGYLLINDPDDVRLWDMSGNMEGDASSKRSADPNNPENLIGTTLMFFSPGLDVSGKNSTMKNEILLYGRILDTKRRASADKDTTRYEKK